jgi:hypothetical protein
MSENSALFRVFGQNVAVPVGIINMLWAYISALPKYTMKHYLSSPVPTELAEEEAAVDGELAEAESDNALENKAKAENKLENNDDGGKMV